MTDRLALPQPQTPVPTAGRPLSPSPSSMASQQSGGPAHLSDEVPDPEAVFKPDPGTEADFDYQNDKFAFSRGHLMKCFNPKSLAAFMALGGTEGLAKGLRTDLSRGLDVDEKRLDGKVSFSDATTLPSPSPYVQGSQKPATREMAVSPPQGPENLTTPSFEKRYFDRKQAFGTNILPEVLGDSGHHPLIRELYFMFMNPILLLLLLAAFTSLGLDIFQTFRNRTSAQEDRRQHIWHETSSLLVVLSVFLCIEFALRIYVKRRSRIAAAERVNLATVTVVRSRVTREIPQSQLLVGDLVPFRPGDLILADGVLVTGTNVAMDESSATGESDLMLKTPGEDTFKFIQESGIQEYGIYPSGKVDPFIISGTRVEEGTGIYLVTAVGINASMGMILMSLQRVKDPIEMERQLSSFTEGAMTIHGVSVAISLFIGMLVTFLVRFPRAAASATERGQWFMDIAMLCISVLGLTILNNPIDMTVDISTTWARSRLARVHCHIQRAYKLGATSALFFDMDVVMQQDKAALDALYVGVEEHRPAAPNLDAQPTTSDAWPRTGYFGPEGDEVGSRFLEAIIFTSAAQRVVENGTVVYRGPGTEPALLKFAHDALAPYQSEKMSHFTVVDHRPLKSIAGSTYTLTTVRGPRGQFRMYMKGSPDGVMEKCSSITKWSLAHPHSYFVRRSPALRDKIHDITSSLSSGGLQAVSLAYTDLLTGKLDSTEALDTIQVFQGVKNPTFLGTLAFRTPLYPGVRECVQACQRLGIFVRLMTPASVEMAEWVARECGIYFPGSKIMKASDISVLTENHQKGIWPRLCAIAERAPYERLDNSSRVPFGRLTSMGEICAMVSTSTLTFRYLRDLDFCRVFVGHYVAAGDDFNVALPPGLSVLPAAILSERWTTELVRNVAQFTAIFMTTSLMAIFGTAWVNGPGMGGLLRPVQVLWIHLLFNAGGVITLMIDKPPADLFDRKPLRLSSPLLSLSRRKQIAGQVIYQLASLLTLAYGSRFFWRHDEDYQIAQTESLVLSALVWMQLFTLVCRLQDESKLSPSALLNHSIPSFVILGMTTAAQILVSFFGSQAFGLVRLSDIEWAISIGAGVLTVPVGLVVQAIPGGLVAKCIPHYFSRDAFWGAEDLDKEEESLELRQREDRWRRMRRMHHQERKPWWRKLKKALRGKSYWIIEGVR